MISRSVGTYVKDRPGHDRREAINCDRIMNELGWKRNVSFDGGMKKTAQWCLDNRSWVECIRSGDHKRWIELNYGERDT